MISEEHWKTDQILFLNVYGQREPVYFRVQGMLIIYMYYVCYFLFYGYLCMTKENVMLKCRKSYGYHLADKGHVNLGHL